MDETSTTPSPPDITLWGFLPDRARRASDTRLMLDAVGGVFASVLVLVLRPKGWILFVSAAVCFLAYGAWGIVDRELHDALPDAGPRVAALTTARGSAAALGAAAFVTMLLSFLAIALGTIIS
jgi:hypothetical protein